MFAIPVVVTINYTTKNLHYLETNDFLGNAGNRTVVTFPLSVAPPVTRAVLPAVQQSLAVTPRSNYTMLHECMVSVLSASESTNPAWRENYQDTTAT